MRVVEYDQPCLEPDMRQLHLGGCTQLTDLTAKLASLAPVCKSFTSPEIKRILCRRPNSPSPRSRSPSPLPLSKAAILDLELAKKQKTLDKLMSQLSLLEGKQPSAESTSSGARNKQQTHSGTQWQQEKVQVN
jgi:hypothetical protein